MRDVFFTDSIDKYPPGPCECGGTIAAISVDDEDGRAQVLCWLCKGKRMFRTAQTLATDPTVYQIARSLEA